MANSNTFFDVLIDQLIDDVRREFEASRESHVESPYDEPKKVVLGTDDLVSQMIAFRARLATPATMVRGSAQFRESRNESPRFAAEAIQIEMAQTERSAARPNFASSVEAAAFAVVTKSGAKFYADDCKEKTISRDALKRERRRVLLTLHPDRAPESSRVLAHEKFLAAAEAFTLLAEASTDSQRAA